MTIPVLLAALLSGCDSSSTTTGTSSETVTGVRLYLPSGAPASGARAELFAVSDTGSTPAAQLFADDQGTLSLKAPEKGRYNLVIRHPDGTSLLQDSLLSDGSRISAWSDTLRPAGAVQGRVKVQPMDSPRIAWVHLLGSGVYANVDDSGRFDLLGVAPGRYTVAFLTRDSAYTPTFRSARIWPDSSLDLGTVDLVYTGLPLVTGVAASYDSMQGVLTMRWNRSKDPRVATYAVIKDGIEMESWRTSDTSLSVNCYPGHGYGSDGWDTSRFVWALSVAVVDSAGQVGPSWSSVRVQGGSPLLYAPVKVEWTRLGDSPFSQLGADLAEVTGEAGDSLLLASRDPVTLSIQVATSNDGISWARRILPATGWGKVAFGPSVVMSQGRLASLSSHLVDSALLGHCLTGRESSCSQLDSAVLLLENGDSWDTVTSFPLKGLVNQLSLFAKGKELWVLQWSWADYLEPGTGKLGFLPFGTLCGVALCEDGHCRDSDSLKTLLASRLNSSYQSLYPGASATWIVNSGEAMQGGGLVQRLGAVDESIAVPEGCDELLESGGYAFMRCGATLFVSGLGENVGWSLIGTSPAGWRSLGAWKGHLVSLSRDGVFMGMISPR